MENVDKTWDDYWQQIQQLPIKKRRVFIWFIDNFDTVIKMCEESNLTEQEVLLLRQTAVENDDTVLEFLMILKGILDSNNQT